MKSEKLFDYMIHYVQVRYKAGRKYRKEKKAVAEAVAHICANWSDIFEEKKKKSSED